jgi:hypothetical protein
MAALLTRMKGLPRRDDRAWMALATSSFPVPLSPVMRTLASVGAAFWISSRTRLM